jgi:hypothetical protein
MKECYEYFDCNKLDCSKRCNATSRCWELDNTLCDTHFHEYKSLISLISPNTKACIICTYYKKANLSLIS